MARPKRIDLPFSLYHVLSRSDSVDVVFVDRKDRQKFLFYIAKYTRLFSYRLHAWCLMPNHFHQRMSEYFGCPPRILKTAASKWIENCSKPWTRYVKVAEKQTLIEWRDWNPGFKDYKTATKKTLKRWKAYLQNR